MLMTVFISYLIKVFMISQEKEELLTEKILASII
jgi:hypothetical protein